MEVNEDLHKKVEVCTRLLLLSVIANPQEPLSARYKKTAGEDYPFGDFLRAVV